MEHALREAHRVLRPDGLLVDLRPGAVHRHVGIGCAEHFQALGSIHRKADDLRAANRAVARVVRAGLFKAEQRIKFDCRRTMDTLDEFQAWRAETNDLLPHDEMLREVERAFTANCDKRKIVVTIPLTMRVLREKGEKPQSKSSLFEEAH